MAITHSSERNKPAIEPLRLSAELSGAAHQMAEQAQGLFGRKFTPEQIVDIALTNYQTKLDTERQEQIDSLKK